MSHTPGPWYLDSMGAGTIVCSKNATPLSATSSDIRVLNVVARTDWGRGEEDEANARLIAAAPDLLTACEAALPWIADQTSIDKLKTAIEKAKA